MPRTGDGQGKEQREQDRAGVVVWGGVLFAGGGDRGVWKGRPLSIALGG